MKTINIMKPFFTADSALKYNTEVKLSRECKTEVI